MEPEVLLQWLQKPSASPYPEPVKSSPYRPIISL
jgi:hypothetical protein